MNTNRHAVKQSLLNLMKQDDHQQAIEAVLNSGLLPDQQLQQWLDNLVERAVRRVLGHSGCSEWETGATKYLSGKDRTEAAARAAEAARAAAWATARAAAGAAAGWAAVGAERDQQYNDLLSIISSLPSEA